MEKKMIKVLLACGGGSSSYAESNSSTSSNTSSASNTSNTTTAINPSAYKLPKKIKVVEIEQ